MKNSILFIIYLLLGTTIYAQTLQEVQQKKIKSKIHYSGNLEKLIKHRPSNVKAGGYGEALSLKEMTVNTTCSYPVFRNPFLFIRDG